MRWLAVAVAVAVAATALLVGWGDIGSERSRGVAAMRSSVQAPAPVGSPTPTPASDRPEAPRAVRLTIGVTGDLLPHLPVVARARALAGGRGYDFRPMLRPIRRWVRENGMAFCHVETPLSSAPPAGYPRFNGPPALARAVKTTGFDACSTASNHSLDRGQAGITATRRALTRAGIRHTGSFSSPAQQRRPLLLRADGVRVALLAYTQMTNGIPAPHPWSVNPAGAERILRDAERARRAGAQVVIVNLHWGTEYRHAPDGFPADARAQARPLARDHRGGRPARPRRAADRARRPALGGSRHGQPALEPDRRLLHGGQPGRDARPPPSPRRARGPRRADHLHADLGAPPGLHGASRRPHAARVWRRTVAVVGRSRHVRPVP
jgi:poly-gamma-glutamate synthesis protein (capsule biosynthesis protein)